MNNNPPSGACRDPLPKAAFKRDPVDFQVDEYLGFEPDGAGEHLWLQIKKTGCNTQDVVDALAEQFATPVMDIGHSGLKDKHAITTQWISVPYPIVNGLPSNTDFFDQLDGVEVLQVTRSGKKLRRGVHRENFFRIRLHDVESDHDNTNAKLKEISETGFPNYFGAQRFGIDGRNVEHARSMFTRKRKLTRFKRSMYLSAARSWMFNQVLSARRNNGSWLTVMAGDVCMLDGTNSVFKCEVPDTEIQKRHNEHDLHITGPLYGRGQAMTEGEPARLETECHAAEELLCNGLENAGLKAERRALRAVARDLKWSWHNTNTLELSFSLQRGVYATSLLGEIVQLQQERLT